MNRLLILAVFLSATRVAICQDTTNVSLLFVGDVMQHDSQIAAAYDKSRHVYDYTQCFQYVKPIVQSADIAIANLEVTLAGPPYKGYPQFSAPDALAETLKDSGFDVLVTANNHSLDRRKSGLERTIDVLDSIGMAHTGTFKDSVEKAKSYPLMMESKGIRFSLLNYTYGTNGIPVTAPNIVNLIDTIQIKNDLLKAKEQATDAIIVFMHWGSEYQDHPNRMQKDLAEFCFNHGATLVIGSHPHVLQPMDWRRDKNQLVAYSLGNFVSGQQSRYRDGGAMLWVEFEKIKTDTLNVTRIKKAGYELEWVYRNMESPKKYFILPLKEFESDTILVEERSAIANLKLFADDSRKLFTENKNVELSDRLQLESSYFKILVTKMHNSTRPADSISTLNFYGLYPEHTKDSTQWVTGKFFEKEIAQQALKEIRTSTAYKDAELVWYYWGQMRSILPAREKYAK